MKSLETLTISDYLSIIKRRVWYVIITAMLVSIGSVVYVRQLPPVYKSETTVQMLSRMLPEDYIRSIDRQTGNERIDAVREQLQSRTFLNQIVQEFQLAGPGFNSAERAAAIVRSNIEITVLSQNTFRLGFRSGSPALAQSVTRRLAERVIQLNDSVRKERAQVADQFLEEQQRKAASQLAQAEEKLYQYRREHFQGLSQGVTADGLRELQIQLSNLESRLDSAINLRKSLERRLEEQQQFQIVLSAPTAAREPTETHTASASASPFEDNLVRKRAELAAASTRYTALHPEVARLKQEVRELELMVAQVPVAKQNPPTQVSDESLQVGIPPEIGSSADLLQAEVKMEVEQANKDIAKLEQAKKELSTRVALYQTILNPPPAIAQELSALIRENDSAKQTYTYLTDRKLNSDMAARVDASDDNELFKVTDAAFFPQFPISADHTMMAIGGCLVGLLLGLGLAFVREFLDPSLQDEESAAAQLKLPVLSSIPYVRSKRDKKNAGTMRALTLVPSNKEAADRGAVRSFRLESAQSNVKSVILDPVTVAGEYFRLMRARLSLLRKQRGLRSLLISSAIPHEGKTFVACCLAGILAQEPGKKVLLVDADLRTASAGKLFGVTRDSNGLSELLRASAMISKLKHTDLATDPAMPELERSLWKCADMNLYFLPSGATVENATDLLSTAELERLLRQAERLFDWVIVDAPPVLGLADSNLIVPITDATVVVVNSRKTPATLVREAVQKIGSERICGILLNQVRTIRSSKYYSHYQESRRQDG